MSWLRSLQAYRCEIEKMRRAAPGSIHPVTLARDFPAWRQALRATQTPLEFRRPWLTFAATRFLEAQLRKTMRVFEWGSGGSTLFFATRVAEVISVEGDRDWVERVRAALAAEKLAHATVHAIPADDPPEPVKGTPDDPACYYTGSWKTPGLSFRQYVSFIDQFPAEHFDVILVDGRARPACLRHAEPKLAPGGWLILDNAERPHYRRASETFIKKGWREITYFGPGPSTRQFWRTTFWQKPGVTHSSPGLTASRMRDV